MLPFPSHASSLNSCHFQYVGYNSSCHPLFLARHAAKDLGRRVAPASAGTWTASGSADRPRDVGNDVEGPSAAGAGSNGKGAFPPLSLPWSRWRRRRRRGDKECKKQHKRLSLRASSPDISPHRSSPATRKHFQDLEQGMLRMFFQIQSLADAGKISGFPIRKRFPFYESHLLYLSLTNFVATIV